PALDNSGNQRPAFGDPRRPASTISRRYPMPNATTKSSQTASADPLARFKEAQREGWAHFAPLEAQTTPAAGQLVRRAGLRAGQRVLDVACGTGVVAVTAARLGAQVTGLDLTPELLEGARENARIAGVDVEWHQGDVEELPFADEA